MLRQIRTLRTGKCTASKQLFYVAFSCPAISCYAFSPLAISTVRHFHVLYIFSQRSNTCTTRNQNVALKFQHSQVFIVQYVYQ